MGPRVGGSARLSSRTHLLQHGLSPHVDAALLVTPPPPPPAPTTAPTQPAMPANLSVAQRRMREMMARRQAAKTGGTAGPTGPTGPNAEPARGAPLKLGLWRLAGECTKVWEVDCPRPSIFGPANEAEREDSTVLSIVWSPDCTSVFLSMLTFRRLALTVVAQQVSELASTCYSPERVHRPHDKPRP